MALLEVSGLKKSFGGLQAVQGFDLTVKPARSSASSARTARARRRSSTCSPASTRTAAAAPSFDDGRHKLLGLKPHQITALGVARTFQNQRLFNQMTVLENVCVGIIAARGRHRRRAARPASARAEKAEVDRARHESCWRSSATACCRATDELASSLSYANRRRLEIARALATGPKLLLLDEPAAGMNPTEIARADGRHPAHPRPRHHDPADRARHGSVRGICERVVALDHGVKIAEGDFATCGATRGDRGVSRTAGPPMLKLSNVVTYYGPMMALKGVSLEVEQGEIVCLLGGNASGKSTTMKTILGLVRPREGTVEFEGERIDRLATGEIVSRGISLVPEGAPHLRPHDGVGKPGHGRLQPPRRPAGRASTQTWSASTPCSRG